jgi:DNA-directed RNA polymerase sigma subunit (sigma70/sigma32)
MTTIGLNVMMESARGINLLTKQQEIRLAEKMGPDYPPHVNEEARNDLVAANIRFVVQLANGYAKSSQTTSVDDYVSAGLEAMVKNAQKFDPVGRGGNFCTFVKPWVQKAFQEIHHSDSVIAVPRYKQITIKKINRAIEELIAKHGLLEEISNEMIAEKLGMTVSQVEESLAVNREYLTYTHSLDTPLSSDEGSAVFSDIIADSKETTPVSGFSQETKSALAVLSPHEIRVLLLTAGLDGVEAATPTEIAKIMDLPCGEVVALRVSARKKMANALACQTVAK